MSRITDKTQYIEQLRNNHRKTIRKQINNSEMEEKRRLTIKKLEGEFLNLPEQPNIKQLYQYSLNTNITSPQVDKVLIAIKNIWKKGQNQNIFLLTLGNILHNNLTESDIHQISVTVRELLDPDFQDKEFIKHISFFCKNLFKHHTRLQCTEQQDDQIQNEERFLPIIKVILENCFDDETIQVNLLKSILGIFQRSQSSIQYHYRIKRNIKLIEMIIKYHLSIINTSCKQQQICLTIYKLAIQGYGQPCEFINNFEMMSILQCYMTENFSKQLVLVTQILCGIYQRQEDMQYQFVNKFIREKFLNFILNKQTQLWVELIMNIANTTPEILVYYLKHLLQKILQVLRSSDSVQMVEICLQILKQIIYCERDQVKGMQFYNTFCVLNGFKALQNIEIQNQNICQSVTQILDFEMMCVQGINMQDNDCI